MNTTAKVLIGALVGGGVGWFIGSVIEEYLQLVEQEEGHPYSDTSEYPQLKLKKETNSMAQKVALPGTQTPVDYTRKYIPDAEDRSDLARFARRYNQGIVPSTEEDEALARESIGEDEPLEESDIPEAEEVDADDSGIIRVISAQEFAENTVGYPQYTLSYYEDDVMTDDKNIPIRKPEELVGPDALVSFGEISGDEDVVYVRNNIKHVDYEVVRTGSNFAGRVERKKIQRKVAKSSNEEQDS